MWNNFIKDFLDNKLQEKKKKNNNIDIWIKKENKIWKQDKIIKKNIVNKQINNPNTNKKRENKEILKKVIQINNWEKENILEKKKEKTQVFDKNNIVKENIIDIWKIDKTNSQIQEIENLTKKEITGYLDNNNNLDKSLLQMDNNKELENISNQMKEWVDTNVKWVKQIEKKKVKFKKNKGNKNLHWIIIEFIIWIILIFISVSHINNNLAEFKFMKSSVQLWSNTFQNIVGKIWWIFSDDVQKNYIQKRTNMIEQLSTLSKKVNKWCDIKDYKELNYKIESFKSSLISTSFTPLDKFIKNYDQYNLYLYSLQELVKRKCKKDTNKNSK